LFGNVLGNTFFANKLAIAHAKKNWLWKMFFTQVLANFALINGWLLLPSLFLLLGSSSVLI
jgi:hypothetical protein